MFHQTISTPVPPPKPHLALHIGVTGHRPDGLNPADIPGLHQCIATALDEINSAYRQIAASEVAQTLFARGEPLPPRLLSPLAEGADSIAAESALSLGYDLHCPLPFSRKVYADDFKHDAKAQSTFDDLLKQADRILELDGTVERKNHAYRNVGYFVLRHSDILLAVWDGAPDDLSPGTSGIVAAAVSQDVPVLWIPSSAPHTIQLHDPRDKNSIWQTCNHAKLTDLLRWCLLPRESNAPEQNQQNNGFLKKGKKLLVSTVDSYSMYFTHSKPRRNLLGTVYRTLFAWFGKGRYGIASMIGNPYRQDAEFQWETLAQSAEASLRLADNRDHFIHSDSLASYYADQYRGTFVASFTLGGLAVLLAQLSAEAELFTIVLIAYLVITGKNRALHQRWLDFRLLAERLRQHAFLAPIGGVSQWLMPNFHHHGDRSLIWID